MLRHDHPRHDHPTAPAATVEPRFSGTLISPSELLDLAEFATPPRGASSIQRRHEVDNLAEWCDHPQLAQHAVLLARGRGARAEVVAVLEELAGNLTPPGRLAAIA